MTIAALACRPRCDAAGLIEEAKVAARQADRVKDLILTHGNGIGPQRSRRAVLPFIGSFHRWLYGTLTEADLIEVQEAIKSIAEDNRRTAALLANQTEIVDHELSDLNERMRKLDAAIAVIANRTSENVIGLDNLDSELAIRDGLAQFRLDTEIITDAILFAVKGLVHPRIMSPETIIRSAKTVQDTVSYASFPLSPDESAAIPIMKISKISVLFANGYLVYHIAIPLIDMEKFALFKASPIPAIQNVLNIPDLAAYIWPAHTYFAVSTSNRTYVPIPTQEVPNLRELFGTLIAVDPEPVRDVRDNVACEIKIAAGRAIEDPGVCNVKIKHLKDTFWLRLHKANTWVYAARQPENIFIQCTRAEQITAQISGTGVLELRDGCSAHTATARLSASHTFTQKVNASSFGSLQFNVSRIFARMNQSAHTTTDLQLAIETEVKLRAESTHGSEMESLKTGAGLRDIAAKAREIAHKKATAFELRNLSNYTWAIGYSSWTLIGVTIIAVVLIWCFVRYRAGKPMRDLIEQQEKMLMLQNAREWRSNRKKSEEQP